jgi:hypothetical protein
MTGDDGTIRVSERLLDKLDELDRLLQRQDHDAALQRASELSDLFVDIKPSIELTPLDALAGFPSVNPQKPSDH